jgi:hypothetical protein
MFSSAVFRGQDLTSFFDTWLYQPVKPTTW